MNKADLVDRVAESAGLSKAGAARAIEAVLEAIRDGVAARDRVTLAGFGTFQKHLRPARAGVNPITKAPMTIEAAMTCTFRAAPALRQQLSTPQSPRSGSAAAHEQRARTTPTLASAGV